MYRKNEKIEKILNKIMNFTLKYKTKKFTKIVFEKYLT